MLYWIESFYDLRLLWGPFRLLGSHLMLLAAGTLAAGFVIWWLLPKYWDRFLPTDKGKMLAPDGGLKSVGKPTGAGMLLSVLVLPIVLLCVPLQPAEYGLLICLYLCMAFGYLDDKSALPWGETKKGLLDLAVALVAATVIYGMQGGGLWLPFVKGEIVLSAWLYIPGAAVLLWTTINATNCSDGVDGLAGTLTLFSLFALVALLYGVVGHFPIAKWFLTKVLSDILFRRKI